MQTGPSKICSPCTFRCYPHEQSDLFKETRVTHHARLSRQAVGALVLVIRSVPVIIIASLIGAQNGNDQISN